MLPVMEDEESLKKRYRYSSEKELEGLMKMPGVGSPAGKVALGILKERGQELRRSARIIAWATVVTAIATIAAALAAWTAIWFQ
jgi:hypothetical protein